jgi:uncharacterized protein YjbI with pentapeptide repeats
MDIKFGRRNKDFPQVTPSEKKELYKRQKQKYEKSDIAKTIELPEDWIFNNIAEAIANCRRIYFTFIALLSYSLLTILTTPDQHLFFGQNLRLPILEVNIPLNFFLLFVPPLAIGVYVYMQLYLLKVNKLVDDAITTCSEKNQDVCRKKYEIQCGLHINCPIHQNRLYPWMHIFSKWSEGFLGLLQKIIGKFSIWWLLPVTQLIISLFIIKKHNLKLFYFQLSFAIAGTLVVLAFWMHNKSWEMNIVKIYSYLIHRVISVPKTLLRTLFKREQEKDHKFSIKTWRGITPFIEGFVMLVLIGTSSGFLIGISNWAQKGQLWWEKDPWSDEVGRITRISRNLLFANLSRENLIVEPKNDQTYDSIGNSILKDSRLEGANLIATPLKNANLQKTQLINAVLNKANLENANLEKANLALAKLIDTNLENANLEKANLTSADLLGAKLKGANLLSANLTNAHLEEASLQKARLNNANLKNAKLSAANLMKAYLINADLKNAKLEGANLWGATLRGANLASADLRGAIGITAGQLQKAVNWQLAYYNPKDLLKFGLKKDHNEALKSKTYKGLNLQKAELKEANLTEANLEGADLFDINLQSADLRSANLESANLTAANLKNALLQEANLQKTILERADLQGADLRDAEWDEKDKQWIREYESRQKVEDHGGNNFTNVEGIQGKLFSAKNYKLALYSKELLEILALPPDHNERVKKKDLSGYKLPNANLQDADLRGMNLRSANLRNADLKNAKFEGADIQGADLTGANLQGADLRKTKGISEDQLLNAKNDKLARFSPKWLKTFGLPKNHDERIEHRDFDGYDFKESNLRKADLYKHSLKNAKLQWADLSEAVLDEADLRKADLREANLQSANLSYCNLKSTIFHKADLASAKLIRSNLENADLSRANIKEANFWGSSLIQADLSGADLDQTILKEANLQGANFRDVRNITKKQLEEATNWQLAYYGEEHITDLRLPADHNKRVKDKKFSQYDFKDADLKNADFENADLRRAALSGANLQEANLQGADLHEVLLDDADIQWANFSRSKNIPLDQLIKAKNYKLAIYNSDIIDKLNLPPDHNRRVINKNFSGYDFQKANLEEANFQKSNLKGADLRHASLSETRLEEANLQKADLRDATGLTKNQIEVAINWKLAYYSSGDLTKFDLPEDHNERVDAKNYGNYDFRYANLKGANLEGATLSSANLRGADLREADLREANLVDTVLLGANLQDAVLKNADIRGADLEDANLQGADLQDIKYLNYKQFSKVKTLYQCQLNETLRQQLIGRYPISFEELIEDEEGH